MMVAGSRGIFVGLVASMAGATVFSFATGTVPSAWAKEPIKPAAAGTSSATTKASEGSSKTLNEGINLFNAKKYAEALAKMDAVLKSDAEHTAAHYYRALSLHYLGKSPQAKTEYEWVIKNARNADMKSRAQTGLNSLLGLASVKPRVYDFYTTWCVPCKVMAPVFEELKTAYKGKVDMESLDAEDPANKALVDKYSVSGFPTFIFVDGSGKQVDAVFGTLSKGQFEDRLQRLIAR